MQTWRGKAVAGAVVLVAVAAPAIVGRVAVSSDNERNYENQLAGCERGNPLREVVFANTENAVAQARNAGDPRRIIEQFKGNLQILLSVPGVDPETGKVKCDEVVQEP